MERGSFPDATALRSGFSNVAKLLMPMSSSVLEPERCLVLAEKGGLGGDDARVVAASGFELVATMNPGGDYGKKELSPELRNRFTEIWVPQITLREDHKQILDSMWDSDVELYSMSSAVLDFADKLADEVGDPDILGLRDIQVHPELILNDLRLIKCFLQAWANFTNAVSSKYGSTLSAAATFVCALFTTCRCIY